MSDILIVGYGIVGKNLASELKHLKPDIFDRYKKENNSKRSGTYQIAFICVDTPYIDETNPCDISEVENAICDNDAEIYVIKSTVLPGTSEALEKKTGKNIVVSPEYYGSTHFSNNYQFDFTILGGNKDICCHVVQKLQNVYDCRHRFAITSQRTAELVKYMENTFLALKVSFCIQFWNVSQSCGVNYEELRELFILDPRIDPSNTFVFNDHPYWESHCYNKDIAAIAASYDMPFIDSMMNFNASQKNRFIKNNQ